MRKLVTAVLVVVLNSTAAGAQVPAVSPTPRAGLGGGAAKAALKCFQAITKGANGFVAKQAASLKKCTDAVYACVQSKPNDAGCVAKGRTTCDKEFTKIGTAQAKLMAAIASKCASADLGPNELLGELGLGFGSAEFAATCARLGVTVADVADVAECVSKDHACRVQDLLGVQVPLAAYLLGLVGRPLHDVGCPLTASPTATPTAHATSTVHATTTPSSTMLAATPTPTETPTETPTTEATATPIVDETATPTPDETATAGPTETPEVTVTPDETATPEPTPTPTVEDTPTPEDTPTIDGTETPTPTPTATPDCGNGILEDGEDCDGSDLGGYDCDDLCVDEPDPAGTLACNSDCTFDFTGCLGDDCSAP